MSNTNREQINNQREIDNFLSALNSTTLHLADYEFNCEISFEHRTMDNLTLYNCTFHKSVSFINLNLRKIFFENIEFIDNVDFTNIVINAYCDFTNVIFRSKAIFSNAGFYLNPEDTFPYLGKQFKKTVFKKAVYFDNARFHANCDFSECAFQEASFVGTIFKKNADFNSSIFHGYANFQGVSFQDKVSFSNISGNGTLDFSYVNFEQNAYFYEAGIKRINLEKCVTDKGLFFLKARIKKANRETCRIIKHEFIKQNNKIESLQYHRREMQEYWCDLVREIRRSPFQFRKTTNNLGNIFLLSLNYISSGFGLWWFMGVAFTFVSTFLVFLWYAHFVTAWDGKSAFSLVIGNGNSQFWRYYFQFLLPTHHVEFMSALNPKDGAYIVDVIGRIVSSFGIYQTVQAFRKYGKN